MKKLATQGKLSANKDKYELFAVNGTRIATCGTEVDVEVPKVPI